MPYPMPYASTKRGLSPIAADLDARRRALDEPLDDSPLQSAEEQKAINRANAPRSVGSVGGGSRNITPRPPAPAISAPIVDADRVDPPGGIALSRIKSGSYATGDCYLFSDDSLDCYQSTDDGHLYTVRR
jgi:hypothetical protein